MLALNLIEGIERIVSFLNLSSCEIREGIDEDIIYVDLGVINAGIGGLCGTRRRLETELALIIESYIREVKGHGIAVVVDIGCC